MQTMQMSPLLSVVAGEDIPAYRLVKMSANADEIVFADAGDGLAVVGSTLELAEDGQRTPLLMSNACGTRKLEAAGAIAVNGYFKAANDGKIVAAGTGEGLVVLGYVRRAAVTADGGDIVETVLWESPRIMTIS